MLGEDQDKQQFKLFLSPPNPILDVSRKYTEQELRLKLLQHSESPYKSIKNGTLSERPSIQLQELQADESTSLTEKYKQSRLVYERCDNKSCNKLRNREYTATYQNRQKGAKKTTIETHSPIYNQFKFQQLQLQKSQLRFDSRFQSGNLFRAYHVGPNEYDLIMQNDLNTKGNNQWYFFSVTNAHKNQQIKINIVNFYKSHSLYNQGMKPVVYSTVANKFKNGIGWYRYGSTIKYYRSDIMVQGSNNKYYYVLSFVYKFDYDNDLVYFSHGYPYTFTDLNNFIQSLKTQSKELITIRTIGTTVLKHNIPLISIGQNIREKQKKYCSIKYNNPKVRYQDNHQSIIILARQHSGESQSSFVCEGIINSLLNREFAGNYLLNHYNFFIFPMVNIDGVINGNYRNNAFGYDLNRNWMNSDQIKHSQTFYIKEEISRIAKRQNVALVLDLHGHSKKMNSFFFGNYNDRNPQIPRLLPLLASKITNLISFKDCTFTKGFDKEGAARIVIQNILQSHNCQVYTFQASFYGTFKSNKKVHFSIEDYRRLGNSIFEAIQQRFSESKTQIKTFIQSSTLKQLRRQLKQLAFNTIDGQSDSQFQLNNKEEYQQIYRINPNHTSIQNTKHSLTEQVYQLQDQTKIDFRGDHTKSLRIQTGNHICIQTNFQERHFAVIPKFSFKKTTRRFMMKAQIQKRKASFNASRPQSRQSRISSSKRSPRSHLINKLRIQGEKYTDFILDFKHSSKGTQTEQSYLHQLQQQSERKMFNSDKINQVYQRNITLTDFHKPSSKKYSGKREFQQTVTKQIAQMMRVKRIQHHGKVSTATYNQDLLNSYGNFQKQKLPYV